MGNSRHREPSRVARKAEVEAMPTGVGAGLRQRREERRISLRQIAAITKISPGALEAIERDDIKRLPGGIFTRAFVRAYAAELELDPERTLAAFLAQFPAADVYPEAGAGDEHSGRPSGFRMAAQAVIVLLPLAALILWALLGTRTRGAPQALADAASLPGPDATAAAVTRPADTAPAPEVMPAVHQTGTMRVVLTMKSDCWVSAVADSRPVVERLLRAGESVELTATQSIVLKAGDAAAVALQINGETGRSLGRAGEVITTRIDPSNVRDFLATP
jgi:cytoskeletal protein RodZ